MKSATQLDIRDSSNPVIPSSLRPACSPHYTSPLFLSFFLYHHIEMQPNQWQQQSFTGYGGGQNGGGQNYGNPSFMTSQPTGFPQQQQQMQPMQTGFRPSGNMSFLNQPPPPPRQNFTGGPGMGMAPQMTGYPGGGASGLMPQQTGFQGGMMSQPTGYGGGLMSQPTGMGTLRAQPTGVHDPRLASMMQSFMPSNMSQVSAAGASASLTSNPHTHAHAACISSTGSSILDVLPLGPPQ